MKKVIVREPVGAVLRVFSKDEQNIPSMVDLMKKAVERLSIKHEGRDVFKQSLIVVPINQDFSNHDCGKTADVLRQEFRSDKRIHVLESGGDLFCGCLNEAIAFQMARNIKHSFIVSPNVYSVLTEENIIEMMKVMDEKETRVVSMAPISDLVDSVYNLGQVVNTCAMWDLQSLVSVGCFNTLAAEKSDSKLTTFIKGASANGEVYYPIHGVEEIIPSIELFKRFGPCVGVIWPSEVEEYVLPEDDEMKKRHIAKMASKSARKIHLANSVGYDLSVLENQAVSKRVRL